MSESIAAVFEGKDGLFLRGQVWRASPSMLHVLFDTAPYADDIGRLRIRLPAIRQPATEEIIDAHCCVDTVVETGSELLATMKVVRWESAPMRLIDWLAPRA